jgi:hypothetical protein
VKFIDGLGSKPTTAKSVKGRDIQSRERDSQSRERTESPGIPEDESIKNITGREEEVYGAKESVQVLQSNKKRNQTPNVLEEKGKPSVVSKSQKSLSRIPRLTSRSNSLEQVMPESIRKSETNVQVQ